MKIAILVEGKTEMAFKESLRSFLRSHLQTGPMPRLQFIVSDGRIPKEKALKRLVDNLLASGFDAVIALTDVYTGTNDFIDAVDARQKMKDWVEANPRFYPHAAQYGFEAHTVLVNNSEFGGAQKRTSSWYPRTDQP